MFMRATLTILLLALGAPAWADGVEVGACPDKQYVIELMSVKHPGVKHVLYAGLDGTAIKAALSGAQATEFLVFTKPGSENRLIVGFAGGCMEDYTLVPAQVLDKWLAGQEAVQ
jgi:hypothetical protein